MLSLKLSSRLKRMAEIPIALADASTATVFEVRVWPNGPKTSRLEETILEQINELTVASTKAEKKQALADIKRLVVPLNLDACVGGLLSEAIVRLRREGWLSPRADSDVVLVRKGDRFAEPGVPHGASLRAGDKYSVFEVFSIVPFDLYRTVQQDAVRPCVNAMPGNAFSAVAPLACATFSRSECSPSTTPKVAGLSLEGRHPGTCVPLREVLVRNPDSRFTTWCLPTEFELGELPFGVFAGPTLWDPMAVPSGVLLSATPPGAGSPSYLCFMLPADTDVGILGFGVVFDNDSDDRVMHCSLILRGAPSLVPWQMDGACVLTRTGGAAAAAPLRSPEVFAWNGGVAAPCLAARFTLHCFTIRGRAIFTSFDADEPGADADIADALDVCASLAPEGDVAMCQLLEDALAARYVLARMDGYLLGELAEAFRGVLLKGLALAVAEVVNQGARRLEAWRSKKTCNILLYATGPPLRVPGGPGVDIPTDRFLENLVAAYDLSPAMQSEFLLASGSDVHKARAFLNPSESTGAATKRASRQRKLCSVVQYARPWLAQTCSTELVLRGVLLSDLEGVMEDLDDPLTNRILLAAAMLALDQLTTDVPNFTYVADESHSLPSTLAGVVGAVECSDGSDGLRWDEGRTRYARFFRAPARSLDLALAATTAAERMLSDAWVVMWGLQGSYAGRFFMLMGDRPMATDVPMHAQLLQACVDEAARPGGGDAAVDMSERAIRARPGEVLFVLLTSNRRVFMDSPALIARVLRGHGFPDVRFGVAWAATSESGVGMPADGDDDCKEMPAVVRFARFFRAGARPLHSVLAATKAAEAALGSHPRGYAGRFFSLMGDRPMATDVPMHAQLLQACVDEAARPGGGDAAVDVSERAIRARPGEVLFVLLTSNHSLFRDAPVDIVRALSLHGFADVRAGFAWHSAATVRRCIVFTTPTPPLTSHFALHL